MTERVVVLGGGIVGLLAAARHRDAGDDVVLVDAARVGGLLRSEEILPGVWVDQGTHVPFETGDPDLDRWLFGSGVTDGWATHPRLVAGNVFGGELDPRTPFPDLNRLDPMVRGEVEAGLEAAPGEATDPTTAADELDAVFGEPARRVVFEPLLEKWYGDGAARLGPGGHRIGTNRVVAFDPERTAQLKSTGPDLALAWHDARVGAVPMQAHYPREGGCGRWIEHLAASLDGVEVREGARASFASTGDRITTVDLGDGRATRVDRVVCTVPAPVLLLAMGRPSLAPRPRFVSTLLVDLVVDEPFGSELFYFTVFDADAVAFRVTLYPNLRDEAEAGPFALTAEVLGPHGSVLHEGGRLVDEVERELRALGVIADGAAVVHAGVRSLAAGFPAPPVGGAGREAQAAVDELDNVLAVGRGAGGRFFLAEVLLDAHRRLPGSR